MGTYITLEWMQPDVDAALLYQISHDSDESRALFRYMPRGPYESEDQMRSFLAQWCDLPDTAAYVVRNRESLQTLGTLSLMNIREEHGVIEIGNVWYCLAAQRTKSNTEAVYLLLEHCFDSLRFRRVEWKCDSRNLPSGRAALRLGFSFEGVFRKHMIMRNENRDTAWFAMLDDDWPARKDALRNWLYTADAKPLSQVHSAVLPY
jgi:RimJ/RimL family protein N-acetyltransferase